MSSDQTNQSHPPKPPLVQMQEAVVNSRNALKTLQPFIAYIAENGIHTELDKKVAMCCVMHTKILQAFDRATADHCG